MSTSQKHAGSNRRNFTCRWTRKYWPMYNCINVAPPCWHPPFLHHFQVVKTETLPACLLLFWFFFQNHKKMIVAVSQSEAIKKNQIAPWWFYWGSCLCTLRINAVKRLNFSYSCSFTEYLCILSSQLLMITLYYDKIITGPSSNWAISILLKLFRSLPH